MGPKTIHSIFGQPVLAMDLDRRMTMPVPVHPTVTRGITVFSVFRSLLNCMQGAGFLIIAKCPEDRLSLGQKFVLHIRKGIRLGYMILMWMWVAMMSLNIFWMAIVVTPQSGVDPTNGQRSNVIITFLEEGPYCLLAIRNALVLTIFVVLSQEIWDALCECEELRNKLVHDGADPNFLRTVGCRPLLYVLSSIFLIIVWEFYEWSVWFNIPALGIHYHWDMTPFPFILIHPFYAGLWWLFISIPFVFSQLAICFTTVFALIIFVYCRYLNGELTRLGQCPPNTSYLNRDQEERARIERVTELRRIHFDICGTVRHIDKTVRLMLLMQFILDLIVMFAFLGMILESKYCQPSKPVLEWSFYIPTAMFWLYLLMHYNMPLISMTSEGEKTHTLVHALTFAETGVYHEKTEDFAVFLEQTRHTVIGFTGRKFYYVNRAYLATCAAVTASYFTVLSEVLDRFYGTEAIRAELKQLQDILLNVTQNSSSVKLLDYDAAA